MKPYRIEETIDGRFMVLIDGIQWGSGPRDPDGSSGETWATKEEAEAAILADSAKMWSGRICPSCGSEEMSSLPLGLRMPGSAEKPKAFLTTGDVSPMPGGILVSEEMCHGCGREWTVEYRLSPVRVFPGSARTPDSWDVIGDA